MQASPPRFRLIVKSRSIFLACVALAAGGLGLAFILAGDFTPALLALAVGLVWALPELWPKQKYLAGLGGNWLSNAWFGLLTLGAVWVHLSGRPWWLAFGIVVTALAAWDLHAFRRRALSMHGGDSLAGFDRAHLHALGWVGLVGVLGTSLLFGLANLLRFSAGLSLALAISLALAVGVILLARLLARP
jgi:hypothetical protein